MDDWLADEIRDGSRVIVQNSSFAAVVPFFARFPYETYIAAQSPLRSLADFSDQEMDDLAEILQDVSQKFDKLFGFSLPYIMVMHQAPCRLDAPYTRFHIEFYPPHRTAEKLKFLAGSEAGAGTFINDTLPEASAERLRNAGR